MNYEWRSHRKKQLMKPQQQEIIFFPDDNGMHNDIFMHLLHPRSSCVFLTFLDGIN